MKKVTLLFVGLLSLGATALQAQITKASLWSPALTQTDVFIYGGNYKNTVQAGVTITVLDKGYVDATKPGSTLISDFKFPHWGLNWHFNNLTDNKSTDVTTDDVPTAYCKVANIASADTLFWLAHATDPLVPFSKTIGASHLPTRNGIFFCGVDALGNHALGLVSGKSWCRLQSYQSGGDAVLVESVDDFLSLIKWGRVIKERSRTGTDPNFTYPATILSENFLVGDSVAAFGLKVGENDNALAFYPGKYDKTNVRLAFQFDESRVSSDISFKLLQVSKGTSGKNLKYKMIVSLVPPSTEGFVNIGSKLVVTSSGCDKTDSTSLGEVGPKRYVIDNVFEAQGGANDMAAATVINVAELIKTKNAAFTIEDFSKKRIIVSIIGEAVEPATAGTYHPIVAIDDIKVSYWINWYNVNNSGLTTGIGNNTISSTKITGLTGQIQITGALASGEVYSTTGQKVAIFNMGNQLVSVPSGLYLVKEQNQAAVKVYVK